MPRPALPVALLLVAALATPVSARQAGRYEGSFERDVNRYRWIGLLEASHTAGPWRFSLQDRFRSDAFLLFDDRLSFRDENVAVATGDRRLADAVRLRFVARSDWFSLSRVSNLAGFAGLSLGRPGGIVVEPMLGVASDRRPGAPVAAGPAPMRTDTGPAVALRATLPAIETGGYVLQGTGDAAWHRIEPRRSGGARLAVAARRRFESTTLRAEWLSASSRRDAYQAASFLNREPTLRSAESVESTRSDTLDLSVGVEAPLADGIAMDGVVRFSSNNRFVRTLRAPAEALFFDSDFGRRAGDLATNLSVRRGNVEARFGAEAGAETERRGLANEEDLPAVQAAQKRDLLRQADYDRGYLTLRFDARVPLSRRTMLQADGSANGIRHDTPLINLDDRDEVFYNGRIGLLFRPDRTLDVDVQALGTWYHTVYLKAARSAENTVQRSLRLRPTVAWRPDRATRVQLTGEVRATYTVDDFVLPGRRPSDQSAREMRYDLVVERRIERGIRLLADGRYSDLRLGRFLRDAFAEIPFDTLRTGAAWIRLQVGERAVAEIGLRIFVRSDFDRSASVTYTRTGPDGLPLTDVSGTPLRSSVTRPGRERILQWGPTTSVDVPLTGSSVLRMEGWYTVQRITRRLYGDLPEESAPSIRKAASRGTRTTIPNLSVSVVWNF